MKYSIVIPTYNHCDDLLKPCIETIAKYSNMAEIELIVSANGCKDNTFEYLENLKEKFNFFGLSENFKVVWSDDPLGYAKATNAGIKIATADLIVVLNNDVVLLEQHKDTWLEMLASPFNQTEKCGITCVLKKHSKITQQDFAVFFCAMIHRKVFDKIGLITEEFEVGSQEDISFCADAIAAGFELVQASNMVWSEKDMTHVGTFPIYHKGEGTVNDKLLVTDWEKTFFENELKLAEKYNKVKTTGLEKLKVKHPTAKYSIVIPTYNHCEDFLKPCVETLLKYTNVWDIELIISANGCVDSTREYLTQLQQVYDLLGLSNNLKIVWNDAPLGYAKSTNAGIKVSTTDLVILLNNDVTTLEQTRNRWIEILEHQFIVNPNCGISCVFKGESHVTGRPFAVFFCVMIHRKVFEKIGLLNEEYDVGGCEDIEFSVETEHAGFEVCDAVQKTWVPEHNMFVGDFPLFHKGEGTLHDPKLVSDWSTVIDKNVLILAKKYNPALYEEYLLKTKGQIDEV